VKPNPSGASLT